MNEYQQLWNEMLTLLKEEYSDNLFSEIFSKCTEVFKLENNYIYVIVPDVMTKYRVEHFFMTKIKENIPKITPLNIGFKFILEKDVQTEVEKEKKSKLIEIDNYPADRTLSSLYRFENFVTGESNRYAWITAMNVAQGGIKVCNPLYIFGDVGLGKTHLMTSIGNYVLDNNINSKVLYTSSQKFTEDFVMSTTYNKGNKEKLENFYKKYNDIDVLLVDDVQFLENKAATQEEFFKIFENLTSTNKQIVLTSDRAPADLKNIMARLKSRFSWGISVEIKKPDEALLIDILKRKLSFLIDDPKDVGEDVLKTLAEFYPTNIRDLEGGLRTFVNYCICMNCSFTKENLITALDKLVPKKIENVDYTKENFDFVGDIICNYFKISKQDIISTSRKQQIVYVRQILMYILRNNYKMSLQGIGYNLGNRDHATVAHGIDKINQLIVTNQAAKNDCEAITSLLEKTKR